MHTGRIIEHIDKKAHDKAYQNHQGFIGFIGKEGKYNRIDGKVNVVESTEGDINSF